MGKQLKVTASGRDGPKAERRLLTKAALALTAIVLGATLLVGSPADAATRVDYGKNCNTSLIMRVTVKGYDRNVRVAIQPTTLARTVGRLRVGEMWSQMWNCVHYPNGLYGWQGDSLYDQLLCHAYWSFYGGPFGWSGGPTWDLESWRPAKSDSYIKGTGSFLSHRCNWS